MPFYGEWQCIYLRSLGPAGMHLLLMSKMGLVNLRAQVQIIRGYKNSSWMLHRIFIRTNLRKKLRTCLWMTSIVCWWRAPYLLKYQACLFSQLLFSRWTQCFLYSLHFHFCVFTFGNVIQKPSLKTFKVQIITLPTASCSPLQLRNVTTYIFFSHKTVWTPLCVFAQLTVG